MKLSSRIRYGIRVILEIALGHGKKPVQLKAIAEREDISSKYLEQLIAPLKIAGLVYGVRGPHGGYILTKPSSEISLKDVVLALEAPIPSAECREHPEYSPHCTDCVTSQIWQEIQGAVMGVLETITLAEFIEGSSSKS